MAEFELPSTETLRRSALTRSTRRGSGVAQRRIALRWLLWGAWQALRWLGLPALLVGGVLWALHREPDRPATVDMPAVPAPGPAPGASPPGLHLRLDDAQMTEMAPPPTPPQAQSGASPIVPDRSSRER